MPSGLAGKPQSMRSLPTVASYMLSRIGAVAMGVFVLMLMLVIGESPGWPGPSRIGRCLILLLLPISHIGGLLPAEMLGSWRR